MPKLPQVDGKELVRLLNKLGYMVVRQRGSHVRLVKSSSLGEHKITIPMHKDLAKGTLNSILTQISLWNNISRDELIGMLK